MQPVVVAKLQAIYVCNHVKPSETKEMLEAKLYKYAWRRSTLFLLLRRPTLFLCTVVIAVHVAVVESNKKKLL